MSTYVIRRCAVAAAALPVALLLAVSAAGAQVAASPDQIDYPPLRDVPIQQAERSEMPNGIVVFLLEDHELPLIDVTVRIRTGSRYEPADKTGLANMTATVMRTGGAGERTGEEVDLFVENRGAFLSSSMGTSVATAGMSVLAENFDEVLAVLADMLRAPRFEPDKIEEAKVQAKSAISRRNDSPGGIASREFNKLVYGPESPYARQPEYATIDAITREDMVAFHETYYHPNQMMIGVTGDFDRDQVLAAIEREFGDWQPQEVELPTDFTIASADPGKVYFVEKTDLTQTNFRLGHLGTTIDDPDYFALEIMNTIFGQGFASRLFSKIRSDLGLAYAIWGSVGASYDYPGVFQVGGETKLESTAAALEAVMAEIERMKQGDITDEELAYAKESYLNSFVFNFDTVEEIVGRQMLYEYYGYPADFLQTFRDKIEAVTKQDVARAARTHLHPDRLLILAVADPSQLDAPLSQFGQVVELDITIPEGE
jgi:zinc protease